MGERYDALVTLGDGAFPFVAAAEGKGETAREIVRTGSGETPRASGSILELSGSVLTAGALDAEPSLAFPDRTVDREMTGRWSGAMLDSARATQPQPLQPATGKWPGREREVQ